MRRTIKQRLTAGFVALALAITNVVLPAQTAFAMEGPAELPEGLTLPVEADAPVDDAVEQPEVVEQEVQLKQKSVDKLKKDKETNQGNPAPVVEENASNNRNAKYDICHATRSATNPYRLINVSYNSIVKNAGHDGHDGPVVSSVAEAQAIKAAGGSWGDIIPAIPEEDYLGKNLTAEGLEILKNECELVDDTPQELAKPTVTPVDPCGLENAYWDVDALNELGYKYITFKLNNNNELVAVADAGFVFEENGKKRLNLGTAIDSGELCAKPVKPEYPKVVDRCGVVNDKYYIPSTEGVEYLVDGEVTEAGWYKAAGIGKVVFTAQAADGYELTKQLDKKVYFTNKRCNPEVNARVFDKCDIRGNSTVWVSLRNTTDSYQVYHYEIVDTEGNVVESDKVKVESGDYFKETLHMENGDYALNVYAYVKNNKVYSKYQKHSYSKELLVTKKFSVDCADKFTPQVYKVDHEGKVISGGVFDVEVCQQGRVSDEVLPALVEVEVPVYEQWDCQTYEDVTFGTDGNWFKENVDGVNPHRDVKVTITETVAPEGCKAGGPWVFNWTVPRYENGTNGDVQTEQRLFGEAHRKKPVGSWDVYGGVFNLENDCRAETPEPEVPVLGVSDERPAPLQPQVLADTGDAPSAMILAALLLITGSAVLAVSPRFAKMK